MSSTSSSLSVRLQHLSLPNSQIFRANEESLSAYGLLPVFVLISTTVSPAALAVIVVVMVGPVVRNVEVVIGVLVVGVAVEEIKVVEVRIFVGGAEEVEAGIIVGIIIEVVVRIVLTRVRVVTEIPRVVVGSLEVVVVRVIEDGVVVDKFLSVVGVE